MLRVPGVNDNETPEDMIVLSPRRPIDTSRLAKIVVPHDVIHQWLNLPDDVKITSMHTTRGEDETGIYMICDRFETVPQGGVAPTMTLDEVNNLGLWDEAAN